MKVLDYFLILCVSALLGVAYFFHTNGDFKLAAIANFCAFVCGAAVGARVGGRIYKKNQENK